jgi:hypothetical protein
MAVASRAAGGTGTTNFNLRVEQNKTPEFFSTKSKDTISAAELHTRITRTTRVIKESFTEYGGITPDPLNY